METRWLAPLVFTTIDPDKVPLKLRFNALPADVPEIPPLALKDRSSQVPDTRPPSILNDDLSSIL